MYNNTLYVMGYEGVTVHSGLDEPTAQRMFNQYAASPGGCVPLLNPFHVSWYGPEGHVNSWTDAREP